MKAATDITWAWDAGRLTRVEKLPPTTPTTVSHRVDYCRLLYGRRCAHNAKITMGGCRHKETAMTNTPANILCHHDEIVYGDDGRRLATSINWAASLLVTVLVYTRLCVLQHLPTAAAPHQRIQQRSCARQDHLLASFTSCLSPIQQNLAVEQGAAATYRTSDHRRRWCCTRREWPLRRLSRGRSGRLLFLLRRLRDVHGSSRRTADLLEKVD